MTPKEYEEYVGRIYACMGYEVCVTPLSNDWGLDIIATRGNEKIGIQAKMYGGTGRSVNRRMIMELYGAAAYQDCTKAVLATDGYVLDDAMMVANKLGIEIRDTSTAKKNEATQHQSAERIQKPLGDFDEIWSRYICPLQGRTLHNSRGSNHITRVDWSGVTRITSNGHTRKIDIEDFRLVYNELLRSGHISREYINQQVDKRCSSGIVLIFSQLPFVALTTSPTGLRLVSY